MHPHQIHRARRLTDTQLPGAHSKVEQQQHAAAQHQAAGAHIAAGAACHQELISVISSYGGGMEANRSLHVGGFKVTYSVHTQAGADPGGNTKDNQDAWCVQEGLAGQDMLLLGVFDGHGQEGKVVSHSVCQALPALLAKLPTCKPATLEAALAAAFPDANRALKQVPGLDADLSGSTGIVAVLAQGKLVVGNLGDSRCVLGKVDARGAVSAVALSNDHTPMDPREADRIIATGGRIASFMCGDEPLGPPRVWLRDINVPGLCMTRSFGDLVAASVGVLDEPQIVTSQLRPEDRYLVLMSDGIFEFIDSQQVLEEVHAVAQAGQPPSEAARRLVRIARKCWQEQEEEIIDDCTAMVAYLSPASAPSSGGGGSHVAAAGLAARLETHLRIRSGSGAPAAGGPAAGAGAGRPAGAAGTLAGALGIRR